MWCVGVALGALLAVLALFSPATDTWAAPPDVSYQGQLLDASGAPLNGGVNLQIRVYPNGAPTEGEAPLFVEDHADVPVTDGVFQVLLGQGTPLMGAMNAGLFADDERYLEVHVNGERIEPRQAMSSVPYAFQAENVSGFSAAQLLGPHLFDVHGNDLGMVLFPDWSLEVPEILVYNTSLQLLYSIMPRDATCSSAPPEAPPQSRFRLGRMQGRVPNGGFDPLFYTEPGCVGQAYVDVFSGGGHAVVLPAATIVSDSGFCSVSLTRLDLDQIKLCPELEFLSARIAGNCEDMPGAGPPGPPGEPGPPGVLCGGMFPLRAVPVTSFDPAAFGFPYPIEGPTRMGLGP